MSAYLLGMLAALKWPLLWLAPCLAAAFAYGRCEDTGKVANERPPYLVTLSDMPAPPADDDAWSDWECPHG